MSNAIRFDALLLRALAAELDARLRGMRVARAQFERDTRTFTVEAGTRRQPLTLSWKLQPAAGHITLQEGASHTTGALLQVPPGTPIAAIRALADERIARIEFATGAAAPGIVRAVLIELLGNRWNACALGEDDVIMAVLVPRPDDPRELRSGVPYTAPTARARAGADAPLPVSGWLALLGPVAAEERSRALLASVAYTSPLNAAWLLGDALLPESGTHVLTEAYQRYLRLLEGTPEPVLLQGVQPYPQPLGPDDLRTGTLLAAFALAAAHAGEAPHAGSAALREQALARIHVWQQRVRARAETLRAEARGAAEEAARLRAQADLLLSHIADVPRGTASIELEDFTGRPVSLRLDPALPPQRNAQRWYEQARRRDRAAARVPLLLRKAEAEWERLEGWRTRVDSGAATDAELAGWLHRAAAPERSALLPYRRYRSSGGLEVRVGRNARANDALTRLHSAGDDIWLHARDAAGAHVVLRWPRRDENPPRQDLLEAAVLAALHSRARTSAVVPVDWTRRKYVRKPRKAAPGEVFLERASTLFVTPDSGLEQRLREEEAGE